MTTHTPSVGDVVRAAMRDRNVSQRKLAALLDLSQTAVSRRLKGEVEFSISEIRSAGLLLATDFSPLLSPETSALAADPQSSAVAADSTETTHAGVVPRPSVPSGAEDVPPTSSALPNLERVAS